MKKYTVVSVSEFWSRKKLKLKVEKVLNDAVNDGFEIIKKIKIISIFLSGVLLGCISCFQNRNFDFVIENVKLFDGNNVFEHANVYVKDGLIAQIDTFKTKIDGKYNYLISGHNKTIIPGLINAHTHPQSRRDLNDAARAGILTVFDLLRIDEDSIPVFKVLGEKANYANYYTAGIGADMPNAVIKHYIQKTNPWAPLTKKGVELFIADRIKSKVDFIKIYQDSRLPEKFSDSIFDKLISEAHKEKLMAVVHSELLKDACYEFKHGADIIAHAWFDSLITNNELKKWEQRNFYIIPTLLVHVSIKKQLNPKSYTLTEEQMINEIGRLYKAGITIVAGSDSPADNLNFTTDFYKELELYARAGMTTIDVLKSATINPSKAFKIKDKGIIKEGLSADFVLINGDLLNDMKKIYEIESVWKKGTRIK